MMISNRYRGRRVEDLVHNNVDTQYCVDKLEVLKLPKQFGTLDKLKLEDFELELEIAYARSRW